MPASDLIQTEAILETLRDKARLSSLRADILDTFNRQGELDSVLQDCAEALVRNLNVAFARIWVLDKAGEILILRASAGLYKHLDGPHGRIPMGEKRIGRIARNLKSELSNSVPTDVDVGNPEWAKREGIAAFAGYPLVIEGKTLGVMAFFARHALSPDLSQELEPVALGIAQWIKIKQAENAFAEQREWMNVTLCTIGDAVMSSDTEGRINFLNPIAELLTGWTVKEAYGRPLEDVFRIIHETTREAVENPVARALREKRAVGLTNHTILINKKGEEVPIDDSASPIRNEKGEIVGVILVFQETASRRTVEKQREEALAEAQGARREAELLNRVGRNLARELELTKVVQIAADAGCELIGAEFGAFYYNATNDEGTFYAHLALSGLTQETFSRYGLSRISPLLTSIFKGKGILRIHDVGQEEGIPPWEESLDNGQVPPFSSFLASPVISRSGSVLGALLFGHSEPRKFSLMAERLVEGIAAQSASALDNSHLYEALTKVKSKLTAQTNALEERVKERTARLEETIKSLEGVSYSIAHDLRGPLRSMEAFSSALLEECSPQLSPTAQEYAKRISASAHRMDALIKELLTYGQLAHQDVPLSDFSADDVVASVVTSLESAIQQNKATIRVNTMGRVHANATILDQALVNLLMNAMKFVSQGARPNIEINAERRSGFLRILIKDNGVGVSPSHQTRIFNIFERLDPKNYPGTGIGLAVVKKSVERMGGTVGVDSVLHEGSTFWIELPSNL